MCVVMLTNQVKIDRLGAVVFGWNSTPTVDSIVSQLITLKFLRKLELFF